MMASRLKIWEVNCVPCHCTRMYPMALMCLFNFHYLASTLPHLRTCWNHHVDLLCQNRCGSRRMPILALDRRGLSPTALNPTLLQYDCKEACESISHFHVLPPSEVALYFPSAISENNELARRLVKINLS